MLKPLIGEPELLLALPEHKTALPGGRRESQSDVFALVRGHDRVVACTIEGKVDEPFGPTVGEWLLDASEGKVRRLAFICETLGLPKAPRYVRYQLLHRTASAAVEAERFMTQAAAMIVHSFSPQRRWFSDFEQFLHLFGQTAVEGEAVVVALPSGKPLYLGWAAGDQRYRNL